VKTLSILAVLSLVACATPAKHWTIVAGRADIGGATIPGSYLTKASCERAIAKAVPDARKAGDWYLSDLGYTCIEARQ